jgi:glucokinase
MNSQALLVDFSVDNSVRIAISKAGKRPPAARVYHSDSLDQLSAVFRDFLDSTDNPDLSGAAFSICGWERDGIFEMPNLSYRIGRTWARDALNVSRLHFVNDCVAAALAIDHLTPSEIQPIGAGPVEPGQVKAMITIGRGLATTCVVEDDLGNALSLPCAGGHSDLAIANAREYAVFQYLAAKYGHVSRCRAVCTPGIAEVYGILNTLENKTVPSIKGDEVVALAISGDPLAIEARDMVVGWLAALASDMALMNGARGGVYLSGSFFKVLGDSFDRDLFNARFIEKGRLKSHLEGVGVFQILVQDLEMIGLSTLFR